MNIKYFSILISMFFIGGALSAAVSPALLGSDTREPVQFLVDGKLYDGYLGIDASNCLRAEVTAGDGDSVLVDDMQERLRGYLIPAHQDVGLDVYMLGDRDEVAFRYGVIEEVYDNGYHKIGVYSEAYHNGETIHFFKPDYLVIHKAVLLQDGGFGILK